MLLAIWLNLSSLAVADEPPETDVVDTDGTTEDGCGCASPSGAPVAAAILGAVVLATARRRATSRV